MKKFIALILSIVSVFTVFAFSACGADKGDGEKKTITVYAPDGAPALSVAKFINDKEDFGTGADFAYNVVAAGNIGMIMQQGKGDIIIMPVNAASKFYKVNSDGYKMAAVITHGNLYVMSKENLTVQDLKGKVVGVIGQGNVPDLTFRAALIKNGLDFEIPDTQMDDKVALKYYADASELIPALKTGKIAIGLLPEPAANKLTGMDNAFKYALDLQELYDAETKTYPQAVVMVKNSVIATYPALINAFGSKVESGVTWVKENPDAAAQAVTSVLAEGLTPSLSATNLNSTVVENCKISWQSAAAAKTAVIEYIDAIRALEEKAASVVADDFFAI